MQSVRPINNKIFGGSLIELLLYLCFMSIITSVASFNFGMHTKNIKEKIQLELIEDLAKSLISSSRFAQANASIIIKLDSLKTIQFVFYYDTKIIHVVQLSKEKFKLISFKTSSIFNNQIEMHPNGFVSPASFTIETSAHRECSLFFSRLGNVRKACRKTQLTL